MKLYSTSPKKILSSWKLPQTKPVVEALAFALRAHAGVQRMGGEDFVSHPLHTLAILYHEFNETKDESLLCAALLHDVIEDTPFTRTELARRFGEDVANLVEEVSRPEGLTKREYLALIPAKSLRARKLKMADRLHNLRSLHSSGNSKFILKYLKETRETILPWTEKMSDPGKSLIRKTLEELEHTLDA